jgi:hypothetical protein
MYNEVPISKEDLKNSHKSRADYKSRFTALRMQADEEDLEELGIHLKQRSRA